MFEGRHPEDVKAAIRKRYGSMRDFERGLGLSPKSVVDVLRGRGSRRTADAIRTVLAEAGDPAQDGAVARAKAFAASWNPGDLIDEDSGFTRNDLDELIKAATQSSSDASRGQPLDER